MTAFASSEGQIGSLTVNCELRSVNHRYCDISFKLPEKLRFLEADLRRAITAKIKRGKIECSLNYKKHSEDEQQFKVNPQAIKELLAATAKIESLMNEPASFSALEVLAFPGVQQEVEIDKEILTTGVNSILNLALIQLLESREREGDKLKQLLEERCQKISYYVVAAHQQMPDVLKIMRGKIIDRIKELVETPDFERLEQEIVLMMQKLDVQEELERLETHVAEVSRVLQQKEPVGRRLDFLMQEMNREANTLGSKSADKEMTQISIELKVLIEQMREQIQNIE